MKQQPSNSVINKLSLADKAAHNWYRFVLSFPPHLVRAYLERFQVTTEQRVLDPFCGTGTTIVECKKLGIASIGIEASALAHFAASVKIDWLPNPELLLQAAQQIETHVLALFAQQGIEDDPLFRTERQNNDTVSTSLRTLDAETAALLLKNAISPLPLHKVLTLHDCLQHHKGKPYYRHQLLALANALKCSISNLHFGPEVGVGVVKDDAPVVAAWLDEVYRMTADLRQLADRHAIPATIHHADARDLSSFIAPQSIDAVITSPPYPNEKDYTRITRLEAVLLGFITSKADLQGLKRSLIRSNTRGVYKDDDDDRWVEPYPEIVRIAEEIETRRIAMGKTSGFERLYGRVTKLYFGGMIRHLASLRTVLRPGAQLGYVVGDQASYLRVMIRTGQILAAIAESLGYEVVNIDLFRTRLSTATKAQLREEVVHLRWHGNSKGLK
ncbi:MAG: DNA methyltransferase [Chloroflexaceae bacterium]|nr:DNA methyltransferase [Chloroflexaceae bacterium]